MKKRTVIFIGLIILLVVMSSCFDRPETYFKFYIPEANMYVTTFKRPGKFYLLMSPTKYETSLSDSIDYVEFRIGAYVNIILDSLGKVYIEDYYGINKPVIHEFNYNTSLVDDETFHNLYSNDPSKKEYILMSISTRLYGINVKGKTIKEKNLFGD